MDDRGKHKEVRLKESISNRDEAMSDFCQQPHGSSKDQQFGERGRREEVQSLQEMSINGSRRNETRTENRDRNGASRRDEARRKNRDRNGRREERHVHAGTSCSAFSPDSSRRDVRERRGVGYAPDGGERKSSSGIKRESSRPRRRKTSASRRRRRSPKRGRRGAGAGSKPVKSDDRRARRPSRSRSKRREKRRRGKANEEAAKLRPTPQSSRSHLKAPEPRPNSAPTAPPSSVDDLQQRLSSLLDRLS